MLARQTNAISPFCAIIYLSYTMKDTLDHEIEILGLSSIACEELRKCNISTVRDLAELIEQQTQPAEEALEQAIYTRKKRTTLRNAIMGVLRAHPNAIMTCEEIRKGIEEMYDKSVSTNIGSIKNTTADLVYAGIIMQASTGQFFYPSNSDITVDTSAENRRIHKEYIMTTKKAILEVAESIDGPFDLEIIREKILEEYERRVSTNRHTLRGALIQLYKEGSLKRIEDNKFTLNP